MRTLGQKVETLEEKVKLPQTLQHENPREPMKDSIKLQKLY